MSLLRLQNVSKSFGETQVLKDIFFDLEPGEIHALIGENGAGKSTLVNIISGIITPEKGKMLFDSEQISLSRFNPVEAKKMGIAHVHQELSLCENMSIAENVFFNNAPTSKTGLVDFKKLYSQTLSLMKIFSLQYSPWTILKRIPFSGKQQIEILKAVAQDARIIIFDEPTTGISGNEIARLFEIIRGLRDRNIGVVYISHKLEEVMAIAQRITVLRDGELIETMSNEGIKKNELISLMVNREIMDNNKRKHLSNASDVVLKVSSLSREGVLKNINLELKKGEIIGIAGLVGAGRSELCDALFGLVKKDSGSVLIKGCRVSISNPWDAVKLQIGYIPEDRKLQGLFLEMSVKDNIIAASLSAFVKYIFVMDSDRQCRVSWEYCKQLSVATDSLEKKVTYLSGGNQQRIMLAKWLSSSPEILIIDEPTKGVDVAAKAEIHYILRDLANKGVSIIMSSSEMNEILTVSDRIMIMNNGMIVGEMPVHDATQEAIMQVIVNSQEQV